MSSIQPCRRTALRIIVKGCIIIYLCPILFGACNSRRDTQETRAKTEAHLKDMTERVRRIESKLARANQERAKLMAQVQSLESKVIHQRDSEPMGQSELVVHRNPKTLDLTDLRRQQRVSPRYWRRLKAFRKGTRMTESQLETLVELIGHERTKIFALPRDSMSRQNRMAAAKNIRQTTDAAIIQKLGDRIGSAWAKFRREQWFKVWKANPK